MEEAQSNNQSRMGMGVVLKKAPSAKGDTEEFEGGGRIIPIPKCFKGISEEVKINNNNMLLLGA
jgi:hypothetical protein